MDTPQKSTSSIDNQASQPELGPETPNRPPKSGNQLVFGLTALGLAIAGAGLWYITKPSAPVVVAPKPTITIGLVSAKTNTSYEVMLKSMKQVLVRSDNYRFRYIQDDNQTNATYAAIVKHYLDAHVDLLVANSTTAIKASLAATKTIPVIFGSVGDPVAVGLVASLDSSENNSTGVTSLAVDLTPRRLEVLKHAYPATRRVYFIYEPGDPSSDLSRIKAREKARELGLTLVEKPATSADQVVQLAGGLRASEADGIVMSASAMIWGQVKALVDAQNREKIPLIGIDRTMAEAGSVVSYGPDYTIVGQQVAATLLRVLKGTKPQEIPIQKPNKIEFVINNAVLKNVTAPIDKTTQGTADATIN